MGRSRRRTRRRRSTPRDAPPRAGAAAKTHGLGGDGDGPGRRDAHPAELQGDAQAGEEEALAVDEEEEEGHGGGSSAVEEVAPGARGDVDGEEGAPRAEERRLGQLEDVEDVDDREPDEEGAEDRAAAAPDEHRQRGDERQTRAEGVCATGDGRTGKTPSWEGALRRPRGGVVGVERAPGAPEILHRRRARGTTARVSTDAPPDVRWPDRGTRARDRPRDHDSTKSVRESARWPPRALNRCCFEVCRGARGRHSDGHSRAMNHREADAPTAEPATLTTITDEVSMGVYCRRMRISALQARQAFLGLVDFVYAQLGCQRGVSLPRPRLLRRGSLRGHVQRRRHLAARARVRALPKFESVPQERGRFFLTKPVTYARIPNFPARSAAASTKLARRTSSRRSSPSSPNVMFDGAPVDVDFTFGRAPQPLADGASSPSTKPSRPRWPLSRARASLETSGSSSTTPANSRAKSPPPHRNGNAPPPRPPRLPRRTCSRHHRDGSRTDATALHRLLPSPDDVQAAASVFPGPRHPRARANAANAKTEPGACAHRHLRRFDRLKNGLVDRGSHESSAQLGRVSRSRRRRSARARSRALREHSGGRDDRFTAQYVPLVLALEVAAAEAAERDSRTPGGGARLAHRGGGGGGSGGRRQRRRRRRRRLQRRRRNSRRRPSRRCVAVRTIPLKESRSCSTRTGSARGVCRGWR